MAFKMNPKSPVLMKAMGYASPAKQRSGGNDRFKDISEEMEPVQERGMKKELRRIKREKPSTIEAESVKVEDPKKGIVDTLPKNNGNNKTKKDAKQLTAKQKALKALKDAQSDNEVANIEKQTSKVKKNSTKKRKQAKRKDSQAERRTEKIERLDGRIERRKARRSPAKQATNMTPAEAKALNDKSPFGPDGKNVAKPPKSKSKSKYDIDVTKAKQGKSPAKEVDKAGQRIIRQGEKAKAAYKAGDTKKGDRHKVRAKRMNGRYNAKMLKNNLKAGRNEISEFEKNIEIQEKFDAKIEKAKGNTKKIARLTKRANSKMDRSAN